MKQADLDRAVARATGETVSTIKRLGFMLADPVDGFESSDSESDEHGPHVIDWDEVEADRNEQNAWRPQYEPVAV